MKKFKKNIVVPINYNTDGAKSEEKRSVYPRRPRNKKFPFFPVKNIYQPELFQNNLDHIERFICGICECICDNPRYQYCGCNKPFCQKCLSFYYNYDHHRCPECKKETKELIPKETFNESILNLNMVCKNRADLCTWTGKFKDYKEHLTNYCPKEYINCPNKECVVKLLREQMPEHLLKCEFVENICDKCQMKYSSKDKEQHKNICPKEIIKCPKGCEAFMERKDIKKHKDNCPNEFIECPYKDLGCDDKFMRKDIKSRRDKDKDKHLYLAIDIVRELKKENNELKKEIGITKWLTEEINNLKEIFKNKVIKNNNEFNLLNKSQDSFEKEEKIKSEHKRNKKEDKYLDVDLNNNPFANSISFLSKKRKNLFFDEYENGYNLEIKRKNNGKEFSLFDSNNSIINHEREEDDGNKENKENNEKNENKENNNAHKDYSSNGIFVTKGKEENMYDVRLVIKHLFITYDNKIETVNLSGKIHYYIFFNEKYDIPIKSQKKYTFKIKLLKDCEWLTVGFCDKIIVAKNNYEYDLSKKNKKKRNLGIYTISTNRLIWNSNNIKQCMKLNKPTINKKNSTISCTLKPELCELEFMLNNENFIILNDVRCFESECFSPCLIFLKNGSIETTFDFPE